MIVPNLTTTVVGAGPAGLLFCVVGRLLYARQGGDPGAWSLRLFDKRDVYARTHRLRLDPRPYSAIQRDLEDPRFDAFIHMLEENGYCPEVNQLEQALLSLAAELGVRSEHLTIGDLQDEVSLPALRRALEGDGSLPLGGRWTVVAADSVHSFVREAVRGGALPLRATHQLVARLRVVGGKLPETLGVLDRYRLSKVLGSIVDYRLNRSGFAEVDLFLTEREHAALRSLGAKPSAPVPISAPMLSGVHAPLFRRVVDHLERGLSEARSEVFLQSTFRLEHTVMPRLTFAPPGLQAQVFLLGDAAVSLPFFRGMACLAQCAQSLAHVHCDLLAMGRRSGLSEHHERAVLDQVRRFFTSRGRPRRFGARLLPGSIVDVRPTVHRGRRAYVVLHRWLSLYGVHVLTPEAAGWRSLSSFAPLRRGAARAEFEAQAFPARRYDREGDDIKRRELSIVGARARLVRGLREFVRLSALLPFPLQSWWLSAKDAKRPPDRASFGLWLNTALAVAAAAAALGGSAPAARVSHPLGWVAWLALPLQLAGGAAYHLALQLESGPHRWVRRVWQIQIAAVFVVGSALSAWVSWSEGRPQQLVAALWWLVLAVPFIAGLYLLELLGRRWTDRADLEDQVPADRS